MTKAKNVNLTVNVHCSGSGDFVAKNVNLTVNVHCSGSGDFVYEQDIPAMLSNDYAIQIAQGTLFCNNWAGDDLEGWDYEIKRDGEVIVPWACSPEDR